MTKESKNAEFDQQVADERTATDEQVAVERKATDDQVAIERKATTEAMQIATSPGTGEERKAGVPLTIDELRSILVREDRFLEREDRFRSMIRILASALVVTLGLMVVSIWLIVAAVDKTTSAAEKVVAVSDRVDCAREYTFILGQPAGTANFLDIQQNSILNRALLDRTQADETVRATFDRVQKDIEKAIAKAQAQVSPPDAINHGFTFDDVKYPACPKVN